MNDLGVLINLMHVYCASVLAEIMDHIERLQVLKDIVRKFPSVNYEVFKYVITHLNR